MRSFRTSIMAALALIVTLPVFGDSPAMKQWVLATAKSGGVGGANFVSSLRIVNPGTVTANVTLTYLAQSNIDTTTWSATGDNTSALSVTVQVPAGQMLPIEDVIGSLFNGSGPFEIVAGGIKVVSDQPVSVLSRTYNSNVVGPPPTYTPGTYGFSIPAQVDDQAIGAGDTGYIPYIAASPDHNSGFRCNFIMLNTVATTSIVNVTLKKQDGTVVGQRDYTLGNLSAAQQGDIAASFGYAGPDQNLFVVVTVKSGGPVVVGTSIVDNAISSLNYAPPTKTVGGATGIKDGIFAFVFPFAQDPYGLAGQVAVSGGEVKYFYAPVVPGTSSTCGTLWLGQLSPVSSGGQTTFTHQADGSISFNGTDPGTTSGPLPGTWTGVIRLNGTTVTGNVSLTVPASSSTCPGATATWNFSGSWAAPYSY